MASTVTLPEDFEQGEFAALCVEDDLLLSVRNAVIDTASTQRIYAVVEGGSPGRAPPFDPGGTPIGHDADEAAIVLTAHRTDDSGGNAQAAVWVYSPRRGWEQRVDGLKGFNHALHKFVLLDGHVYDVGALTQWSGERRVRIERLPDG